MAAAQRRTWALTVRQLPRQAMQRLQARARANHRSMEAEARAILLEQVARPTVAEWQAEAERLRAEIPPWRPGLPTAAELVRDGRDEER
jgi:plasmid stability protein